MTATNEFFGGDGAQAIQPDDAGTRDTIVVQLNSLLRGEISAAETYKQAIDKVNGHPNGTNEAKLLRQIQEEHGRAAQGIRERIRQLGGEAADSSGAWGVWASAVQGTMGLLAGQSGALKALKEGEEHGLKDYREAVDDVDGVTAQLIQNQLIPAQQRHINLLDQMLASAAKA
jgi:bacterioferritin (cytochrome b1)